MLSLVQANSSASLVNDMGERGSVDNSDEDVEPSYSFCHLYK
jgi:hypothetical protein